MVLEGFLKCMHCGFRLPPNHSGPCPNCGKTGTSAEAFGSANIGFSSVQLRVKNPKTINGKKELVTTVKTTVLKNVQETTLKRTLDGEHADLQLKFINNPDGKVEYVHVHCQKDYDLSPWGKSSGEPLEKFYEFSQENGLQIVRCKICMRAWPISGWAPE